MIKHAPLFDVESIAKKYTEKDGVPVKYVCSTDLRASDVPVDVFYRDTPHPEFGNRYFGIYHDKYRDVTMITNADVVEELQFGMIEDKNGDLWYSQCHHDCLHVDGKMIDGGRQYIRSSGGAQIWKVQNGEMIKDE